MNIHWFYNQKKYTYIFLNSHKPWPELYNLAEFKQKSLLNS